MAKDLNNAGKDLYKGKKSIHELLTGSKKSEKLDEWKIVKSKTMAGSNPLSRERSVRVLKKEETEIDKGGHASISNLAKTLEVHAALNRLEERSSNLHSDEDSGIMNNEEVMRTINNEDMGINSHSRAAANQNFSSDIPFADTAVETFYKEGK